MTGSCVSICTLTVQNDNSVIIRGPDLGPNNTDWVLGSIIPLVKTIRGHLWERAVTRTGRDKTASTWNKVARITTAECFQISTFNYGTKSRLKIIQTAFIYHNFSIYYFAISWIPMFGINFSFVTVILLVLLETENLTSCFKQNMV